MKPEDFLTEEQKGIIVAAIKEAETNTSGEIRIHLDGVCKKDPYKRAVEVFHKIGMEKTQARNGVLIYVSCGSKVFSIIGDKGINEAVPENFWNDIAAVMTAHFSKGEFTEGLAEAVKKTGEKLKEFFPYQSDDINEQSDEISFDKQ